MLAWRQAATWLAVQSPPLVSGLSGKGGVITLGDVNFTGQLQVISEATEKTFGAAVHSPAITLNNSTNNIAGALAIKTVSPTVTIGGQVKTGINQTANTSIVVTGASTFIAESSSVAGSGVINLTNPNNHFGPLTLSGTDISLTESVGNTVVSAATATNLAITSSGTVTQTGAITTGALTVAAGANQVSLNNSGNVFTGLVSLTGGTIGLIDSTALQLGAVSASGDVSIATLSGNLTATGAVSTTSTTDSAVILNAGKDSAAGIASGGNIIISGGSVAVGTGGRATLYSGSATVNTGLTALVGSGSGHFRYDSDEAATHYTTSLGTGTYAIYREQPTLTLTADNALATYGIAPTLSVTAGGRVNGDTTAQSVSGATFAIGGSKSNSNNYIAGDHAITITGAASELGYAVSSSYNDGVLTVNRAALTISGITAANKEYDRTTSATVTTTGAVYGGKISGDLVSVSTSGLFSSKDAANNKTVTLTSSYSGADKDNYTITNQASALADITPKALTISGITAANKTYDGNNFATVATGSASYSGLISGDAVSVSASGLFNDKTAATGKTVTITSNYSGADKGNYTITDQTATTADITPKALTISGITAANKEYDRTTSATVTTTGAAYGGLVTNDNVTVSATGLFSDKNAANNKNVTLTSSYSGSDMGNYTITDQASVLANITPKALTLSGITAANKTYDGNNTATVSTGSASYSGLISGDLVSVSATGLFNNKNAANGKTVTLTSSYSGDDKNNYTITDQATVLADITPKALTISGITAANKTYDGDNTATVSTIGAAYGGKISGDNLTVSVTGLFNDKNADNGKTVTLASNYSGSDVGNYTITDQASVLADITKKDLVVSSIGASNKVYDGTNIATVTGGTITSGVVVNDDVTINSISGLFSDKNVNTGKTVTISGGVLGGADAGNYNVTGTDTATANITPKDLTISGITAANKTYDGNTTATVSTGSTVYGGLITNDNVTVSATGIFSDKNAANGKTVTITSSYDGADKNNYTITNQASVLADITPKALTISGIAAANKTYDGNNSATISTSGAVYGGLVINDNVTVSATGLFNDKTAATGKTVTITSSYDGTDKNNYTITNQASVLADITPKTLTISGITAANKTYDGNNTATVSTSGVAYGGLITNDNVTVTATGLFSDKNAADGKTVTLASSYDGIDKNNYTITNQASALATISRMDLTVSSFGAANKVYDGTAAATITGGNITAGVISGDNVILSSVSGNFADKHVGNSKSVTITGGQLSGTDAANYTVLSTGTSTADITPASLAISGITAANKTYDGTSSATVSTSGISYTGLISGDDVTAVVTGLFSDKNAADGKTVTLSSGYNGTDRGNYAITDQATTTASISRKDLTVSTIGATNKVYDGTVTATVTGGTITAGVVSGDNVSLSSLTGAFNDKNVADGKTVSITGGQLGGTDAGNYNVTGTDTAIANITPASLTISGITAANKTYDGISNATVSVSGVSYTGLISGDDVTVLATGLFSDKNAADGKTVTIASSHNGIDKNNYTITDQAATTANISRKDLTISTIGATNKVYDGSVNATVTGGAITAGVVSGDDVALSSLTGAFSDKNVADGKIVSITGGQLSGTDAGNYNVTGTDIATADITPKALAISGITAANKTYDGNNTATVSTSGTVYGGLINNDSVTVSAAGLFSDKHAANGKTITLASSYSGSDVGNYTITDQASTLANISKKDLTVSTIGATNKVYDGTVTATVTGGAITAGVVSGDDVTLSSVSGNFADKHVGNSKSVTITGGQLSGSDAGNYNVTGTDTAIADITPASLAISGITAANKTYDGNDSATVSTGGVNYTGLISGDDVTVLATGLFSDKNANDGKIVTLSSGYNGTDRGNYTITDQATTTASISRKDLTVSTIGATNKVYDGTVTATVTGGTITAGVVSGDSVSLSSLTGVFSDKNVADGKTVSITGGQLGSTDAGNYNVTGTDTAVADITPASLAISGITAANKVYDGSSNATVSTAGASYTGLISGDDVTAVVTGLFSDKNAADGKTVTLASSYNGIDKNNYTITDQATTLANISRKDLTISTIGATSKVYDGSVTATVTGGTITAGVVSGDSVSLSSLTGVFSDKNVADGKTVSITGGQLGGTDGGNYNVTGTDTAIANITPASLAISGITAANKVYDGSSNATVSTAGAGYTGLISGDVVSVSATGLFGDKNAADGKTVTLASSYNGIDKNNYTITDQATTTANISRKDLTISTIGATSKVYDGTVTATVTGGTITAGIVSGDDVTLSSVSGNFADKHVGNSKSVTITGGQLGGTDAGNYNVTGTDTAIADITPASLAISGITAANKTYDGNDSAAVSTAGASYTGLISGDDVTVLATGLFSDKNAADGKTVTLSSGYNGADRGNYTITDQAATLANITPKTLAVSAISAANKTYDGTIVATMSGGVISGVIGADDVSLTSLAGTFSDKNAANGKTVTVSGGQLAGVDKDNYSIATEATTTANITKRTLTLTDVAGQNKVYDGNRTATVLFNGDDRIAGDVLNLSGTSQFVDKDSGTGKAIIVSGITISPGVDAGNYQLASSSSFAYADISKKALTVSAIAQNKTYDATTAATITDQSLIGVVSGESVTVSGNGTFADKNAGNSKSVTTSLAIAGADVANYTLIQPSGLTADISKATLTTAGAVAQNKVYDATTAATITGETLVGIIGSEVVTVSGSGSFIDKNAGNTKSVIASLTIAGADAANYTLAQPVGLTADISKATLTITGAVAQNKVYDATTAATITGETLAGVLLTDTVTVSGGGSFADKNAGNTKAVTAALTLAGADAANYNLTQPVGLTADIS
ncbi:MAG: YDG domain-containing protein, partial [Desulfuromonadaceae bacterium]